MIAHVCVSWLRLQEDSEREKAAALDELESRLREQHQHNELGYTDQMNQLTAQLQQLDTVVSQVSSSGSSESSQSHAIKKVLTP